jgi:hypothetical protein
LALPNDLSSDNILFNARRYCRDTAKDQYMKRITAIALTLSMLAMLTGHILGQIAQNHQDLFDGRDLTGWKTGNQNLAGKTETPDGRFTVTNSEIVVNRGRGVEILYTMKKFNDDFRLSLEFRASPRADSGLYIRGRQLQVRDYPTVGPYKVPRFHRGGWNSLSIRVTGQSAFCTADGDVLETALKVPANGAIGLQAETGTFEYRNIRIEGLL